MGNGSFNRGGDEGRAGREREPRGISLSWPCCSKLSPVEMRGIISGRCQNASGEVKQSLQGGVVHTEEATRNGDLAHRNLSALNMGCSFAGELRAEQPGCKVQRPERLRQHQFLT